jgi:hypothetical protein
MIASPQGLSFTTSLAAGNPLHQIVKVSDTEDQKWTVRNETVTPWLRVTPNAGNCNGFFNVSVNVYDPSVVIGLQTALLFVESQDPTIQITITLSVTLT